MWQLMRYKLYLLTKAWLLGLQNPRLLCNKIIRVLFSKRIPYLTKELENSIDEIKLNSAQVIFNTVQTGGTYSYINNLSHKNIVQILVNSKDFTKKCTVYLKYNTQSYRFQVTNVFEFLERFYIAKIIVNHLLFNSEQNYIINKIIKLKLEKQAILNIITHDYFYLCPTVNLLNYENKFCGVPVSTQICENCLANFSSRSYLNSYVRLNNTKDIKKWRDIFISLLQSADIITTPSEYVASQLIKIYPFLTSKIEIRTHNLDYLYKVDISKLKPHKKSKSLTVGVLGEITPTKGSMLLYEIIGNSTKQNLSINWLVIGDIVPFKKHPNLIVTGSYNIINLVELINTYQPDIFIIPSICPETYCYTVSEVIYLNYPLVCFNIGAQGERVSKYKHGVVVSEISAKAMLDAITSH